MKVRCEAYCTTSSELKGSWIIHMSTVTAFFDNVKISLIDLF